MIDTHAHIYADAFASDLDDTISRAKQAGLTALLMPNVDAESIEPMLAVEAAYPDYCFAMMGLHPTSVTADVDQQLAQMQALWAQRDFIAVGEIGIDLYWDDTFIEQQKHAFVTQVAWAKAKQKPVVIHTRDSTDLVIELLAPLQDGSLRGVFHCFGGTLAQAQGIIALGFHLGIGGVSTFKNGGLDQVLPHLDLQHLIIETDCPYLAPVPHRGKRNEPAYCQLVAARIAELMSVNVETVAQQTTHNAQQLFVLVP
ncbi:TatD family hydrolase [Vibrio stylophorae]|uniref:TatD family hydrolase n=1 Tax=Vibrio stylophorae TaxID=659351 RepID=UPI001F187FE2|nr:TatD family hydrolase [Vibrio stylophorae]